MLLKKSFSTQVNADAVNFWLLISRVVFGILMIAHGWPKYENLVAGNVQFADPLGIGETASLVLTVFAEFFCAILLVLGLATRFATVPLIITMLVAVFLVHGSDPFGKGELAVIYLVIFIGFSILGAGKYSLDHFIKRSGNSRL